jgi:hypothetical protein
VRPIARIANGLDVLAALSSFLFVGAILLGVL